MKKRGENIVGKLRALIDEKSPKLDKETKKKTDHSIYAARVKNLQNLARKTRKKP